MKVKVERRGRPRKQVETSTFDVSTVKTFRGNDLYFSDSLFKPLKTNREIDIILSTDGGLMPGTNMVLVGGPGSGKSTIALDMLSGFTQQGYKCLFISAEMDEIAHYKYCKRMPSFSCVDTLFLKNYAENIKDVLEHVLNNGYDVVAVDSIAEVERMKLVDMSMNDIKKLAYDSIVTRYGKNFDNTLVSVDDVINSRRFQDNSNDLFTVFNRIQENLTYDITNYNKDIKLNKELFELASVYAN